MNTILYTGNINIFSMNAAGKRVFNNSLALKNAGYEVAILSINNIYKDLGNDCIEIEGIKCYGYPYGAYEGSRYNVAVFTNRFKELCYTLSSKPDVIIVYGSPTLSLFNMQVLKYAKANGIKVVGDIVDWLPQSSGSILFRVVKKTDDFIKRHISYKYNGIISISTYFEKHYKNHKVKTIVVPPLSDSTSAKLKRNQDEIIRVVYAGIPFKVGIKIDSNEQLKDRIDLIIQYLANVNIPNLEVSIYGFDKDELLKSLPDLKQSIDQLKDQIVFYGKVPMTVVTNAIEEADFTILLRNINLMTTAGFPSKVPESIGLNTPVITNRTSDIDKYVLEDVECYFLPMIDQADDIEKLRQILAQSKETLDKKRQQICERKNFYYKKYSEKLRAFIEQL